MTIKAKATEIKLLLIKLIKDPLLLLTATKAYARWFLAGCPTRTNEEIHDIFHNKCSSCEHFNKFYEDEGECGSCGCFLKDRRNLLELNKIQFRTEKCPEGTWK